MPFHLLYDEPTQSEFAAFTPENFEEIENPPLIVFLHGSGERGEDPGLPLKGIADVMQNYQLPAAVIFPQCDDWHRAFYGEMENLVFRSIDQAEQMFGTDRRRIFLMGYSMGGSSTLWVSARHRDRFVAVVCIAPGITWMGEEPAENLPESDMAQFEDMFVAENRTENIAREIQGIPIWFLQGTDDEPCPIEETRSLVEELHKLNSPPIFTEYEGVDHESLVLALEQEGLFEWLFSLPPKS